MADNVCISVLCVEDELMWQERVVHAANSRQGIAVDCATEFGEASDRLKNAEYDVVTLDSRLGGRAGGQPRIHQLLRRVQAIPGVKPVAVAITGFAESDVSEDDRRQLFAVIEKHDVESDVIALKRRLLDAAHESLIRQCRDVLLQAGLEVEVPPDEIFSLLKRNTSSLSGTLAPVAETVLEKYFSIYLDHVRSLPQEVLTCQGTVLSFSESYVEAELYLDGKVVLRQFSCERFRAAGIFFEHSPFKYTVTRHGPEVRSVIEPLPVDTNVPNDVDLSFFDGFEMS